MMGGSAFANLVFVLTLYEQEPTVITGSGEKKMNRVVVSASVDHTTRGERHQSVFGKLR